MEEENIDPDYLNGFNNSYILAQHMPELAEQLSKIDGNSPRLSGMRDGYKQYTSEKMKEKLPSWLNSDRSINKNMPSEKQILRDVDPPSK